MVQFVAPLPLAHGFFPRLLGLGPNPPDGRSIAFRTRSVHTFGTRRSLAVAALDKNGFVIDSKVLAANRIYFNRRAHWIGEWTAPASPPAVGSRWLVK